MQRLKDCICTLQWVCVYKCDACDDDWILSKIIQVWYVCKTECIKATDKLAGIQ